jgi:hypothetical protein
MLCWTLAGTIAVPKHGPFNRWETPDIQTPALALKQVASGEIWARTPKNGGLGPTVQAYAGVLVNRRGIEFTTDIEPHPNGSPFEVRWYLRLTAGVQWRREGGEEFACIAAAVKNLQP